jgi:hypothetical protein
MAQKGSKYKRLTESQVNDGKHFWKELFPKCKCIHKGGKVQDTMKEKMFARLGIETEEDKEYYERDVIALNQDCVAALRDRVKGELKDLIRKQSE